MGLFVAGGRSERVLYTENERGNWHFVPFRYPAETVLDSTDQLSSLLVEIIR